MTTVPNSADTTTTRESCEHRRLRFVPLTGAWWCPPCGKSFDVRALTDAETWERIESLHHERLTTARETER